VMRGVAGADVMRQDDAWASPIAPDS